jgi:hypothetical protein
MVGNVSDIGVINSSLALLVKNARAVTAEVQLRTNILRGRASYTPRLTNKLSVAAAGKLTLEHEKLQKLYRAHAAPFWYSHIKETHGPFRLSVAQFDEKPREHDFFFYIIENGRTGLLDARVALADRYYFLPIAGDGARFGGIGRSVFDHLIGQGHRYFHQPATSFYASRSLEYWPLIATLVDKTRRPELQGALLHVQHSSMLDLMLAAAADDLRSYTVFTVMRKDTGYLTDYRYLYTLLMRTHPGIFYLPFNGSVWRIPERPNLLGVGKAPEAQNPYVSEEKVLTEADATELQRIFDGAHIREEYWKTKGYVDAV